MAADPMTRTAIDDIFDNTLFDLEDDPFAEKPAVQDTRDDKATLSPRSSAKRKAADVEDQENFGLGLDEEVKIAKKRKPIAKLDEARLLSEPGIPKIRALIRSKQMTRKLRFKGKGHEFSDAARLLNYYQLWLDNLYPRAKFADALQLVEKAGHTKRMHMMRSEWINEGKPGYVRSGAVDLDVEIRPEEMPELFGDSNKNPSVNADTNAAEYDDISGDRNADSMFIPDRGLNHNANGDDDNQPEDDELDALLAMQDDYANPAQRSKKPAPTREEDSEGEDDLDALLAEQDARQSRPSAIPMHSKPQEPLAQGDDDDAHADEDEDDLDALLAEQEVRQHQPELPRVLNKDDSQQKTIPAELDDEDDEDDDLMAVVRESELRQSSTKNADVREELEEAIDENVAQHTELHDELLSSSPVQNEK